MIKKDTSLKFLTFWAINGELVLEKLKEQLKEMKQLGFAGTVFHPRYYPNEPKYLGKEYLSILSELILYAKELEMEFWIYDENGWPSGRAGGQVLEKMGECICEWLVYEDGRVQKKRINQVNTFSGKAMELFVQITYDGYRLGLSKEAFHYVTGFFSDEVGFLDGHGVSMQTGGIPWHEEIEVQYEKKYGEKLSEKLECLFVECDGYQKIRYRFWETASQILSENFYKRIESWCKCYGKRYTAHLKGEENIFFQISPSGSAFRNLMQISTPAIDALERFPGNHYYPRIASSISKQFSDGICLAEAMGGSGWGISPKDMEKYVDWLAESGISYFVFHISQYKKNTASVMDWPPDIPAGLSWKTVFPELLGRLHRRWDKKVVKENEILLVAPVRRVMSEFVPKEAMEINEHNGDRTPLSKSGMVSIRFAELVESLYNRGMKFDVSEEWITEEFGKIKDNRFYLNQQSYDCVIFGDECLWEKPELADNLKKTGIGFEAEQFNWRFIDAEKNQILLEQKKSELPLLNPEIICKNKMMISSMDALAELKVMGEVMLGQRRGERYEYHISKEVLQKAAKKKSLLVEYCGGENCSDPMVFLEGSFLVKSEGGYRKFGQNQLMTTGPFVLCGLEAECIDCQNLISSGYPFMKEGVFFESLFYIGKSGQLVLGKHQDIFAQAAEVTVDGKNLGFCWGDDWSLKGCPSGVHRVEVKLFPSTYNTYGPHHYYLGDYHLTSPGQYVGEKNFADAYDAPENTKTEEWHFVKFGLK